MDRAGTVYTGDIMVRLTTVHICITHSIVEKIVQRNGKIINYDISTFREGHPMKIEVDNPYAPNATGSALIHRAYLSYVAYTESM